MKLLFTFAMLVVFRFTTQIPVPGVDSEALAQLFAEQPLLGMLDLFSGGALKFLSIAAMGVYPYITASIIMQLLIRSSRVSRHSRRRAKRDARSSTSTHTG